MNKLTETLKTMLNALAHADAGEYLSTGQKRRILSDISPNITAAPVANETVAASSNTSKKRHIALYLGSDLPREVMDYALETCARLDHDLTVLTFDTKSAAKNLLAPYQRELANANIGVKVVALDGDPVPRLSRFLRGRPEIAFLACRDTGYLGHKFINGAQQNTSLPVPVVVIATGEDALKVGSTDNVTPLTGTDND